MSAAKARRTSRAKDPIFVLIAAHAKAVKVQAAAEHALERLKEKLDAHKHEKGKSAQRRLTCETPYFDIGSSADPVKVIISREQIPQHVWNAFDELACNLGPRSASRVRKLEREAVEELSCRYVAFQRAHSTRRKAVGLTAKQTAAHIAGCDAIMALSALVKVSPTTPEGRIALAKHLATLGPSDGPWWAMREALERLAA